MQFRLYAFILASATGCLSTPLTPEGKCASNNPAIVEAIKNFCAKTDIVVPSWYAGIGGIDGKSKYVAQITGNCAPKPQWVPQKYCFEQFYDMCGHYKKSRGDVTARYGEDKCQNWEIASLTGTGFAPPK